MLEGIPRKVKIIVNPRAGGGKGRRIAPLLRQKLLERKISFHLQFSESAQEVTHIARQAQGEGYNIIVSCGGDGTAHYTLPAMVGSRFVLGFIPAGTGNDLPANLSIGEDLDRACDLLAHGRMRKIDVVEVDRGAYIGGVGGVGFDAEVNAIANKLNRLFNGKSAYVLPVLYKALTYRPKEICLGIDGEEHCARVLMVAFGNIKSYGRGMKITPLAEPDDGLLDVCWIDPVRSMRLYRFFPSVFEGEHINMPEVHYYRTAAVRVESPAPLDLYGDGEFIRRTPFTLRVLPQALRVLVP